MPAVRHIAKAKRSIPGKNAELSVVIPAAGIGSRMRYKEPKALLNLSEDVTIVERQLETIWQIYPKADILMVIGYKADKIRDQLKRYPVRFIYNPIHESTNVTFSISLGLQAAISSECLIVYGDLVFNEHAINTITDGNSKLLVDSNGHMNDDEVGVIIDEKNHISNLSFGLTKKWCQIAYLRGKELEIFKRSCYKDSTSRWFGYETLNDVINEGGILESYTIQSSIVFDIDTTQDLQKAKLGITI